MTQAELAGPPKTEDRTDDREHRNDGALAFDILIIATGATHAYFGHDEWERYAPGLKTLKDALDIRRRVLLAFETAEREEVSLALASFDVNASPENHSSK